MTTGLALSHKDATARLHVSCVHVFCVDFLKLQSGSGTVLSLSHLLPHPQEKRVAILFTAITTQLSNEFSALKYIRKILILVLKKNSSA